MEKRERRERREEKEIRGTTWEDWRLGKGDLQLGTLHLEVEQMDGHASAGTPARSKQSEFLVLRIKRGKMGR